jgi:hypothetical protein
VPDPVQGARTGWELTLTREEPGIWIRGNGLQIFFDRWEHLSTDGDGPPSGIGLRLAKVHATTSDLDPRTLDGDEPGFDVEVAPLQPENLTSPQLTPGGEQDRHAVPGRRCGCRQAHLARGRGWPLSSVLGSTVTYRRSGPLSIAIDRHMGDILDSEV